MNPSFLRRFARLPLFSALAALALTTLAAGAAETQHPSPSGATAASPIPSSAPTSPSASPRRDPLAGGPFPALFVAQAQFVERVQPDGTKQPVPGYAKVTIVRSTPSGWQTSILEDPESNVFHKVLPWEGGLLTIGGTQALLKTWQFTGGAWHDQTRWNVKFGGKMDRLRDVQRRDVDGDGKEDLVIATHDQGVVAIVHPSDGWRVEEIDRQPDTFVHEIQFGDVDGDHQVAIFASTSKPNKLDREQPGEVRMYKRVPGKGWVRSVVDAPGDTHAKEILTADVDRDGKDELYVVWEGAIGAGGELVRPVTIKQYKMVDGKWLSSVVATVPDRQLRRIAAGDVNGDGKIDIVGGGLGSGLWLFEQNGDGTWKSSVIDKRSSGFEHPVLLADLDGDGKLEIYVAAEDQAELRRYRWRNGTFESDLVTPLTKGDISWNITAGRL
jgi:hypothetical protein